MIIPEIPVAPRFLSAAVLLLGREHVIGPY